MLDLSNIDIAEQLREIERCEAEDSLYVFLRAAWLVAKIDPAKWTDGWPMEAVCEHLAAVVDGDIRNLIINIPPRCAKSSLCSVAFPAWVWAQEHQSPTSGPGVPLLHASYASKLALRDSVKCRRLIQSPWYQSLWGKRFQISSDQNVKSRFTNDKGGERLITSVDAGVTGEGGNIICFPRDEVVATEHGYRAIGDIVDNRDQIRVWSYNHATGKTELKPIAGWFRNPGSDIVRVTLSDGGSFRCTPEHHIWTARGWVEAQDLRSNDMLPSLASAGHLNGHDMHSEPLGECLEGDMGVVSDFSDFGVGQLGKGMGFPFDVDIVPHGIGRVLCGGSICEIGDVVVGPVPIEMANMDTLGLRANEGPHHQSVNLKGKAVVGLILPMEGVNDIAVFGNGAPFHHGPPPLSGTLLGGDHPIETATSAMARNLIPFPSGNRSPLLVEIVGHEFETFCIGVESNHNFYVGHCNALVSNCIDDPNAANEAFSEATIQTTIDWWTQTMSTRSNDAKTGAYIVIQQRLAEDDLTGHILSTEDGDWTHLCLPMRYESDRSFMTPIGWTDPRGLDDNGDKLTGTALKAREGSLLWPDRFGEAEVKRLERILGPFGAAGQLQQRPEPQGGGIIKRAWWQLWDQDAFPAFDYVLAALDTAYTTETTNDYSALTIWGVFTQGSEAVSTRAIGRDGRPTWNERAYTEKSPKIMLMSAWQDRLELHELVEKVAKSCKTMKVDKLLIENKAAGISVAQEIRRVYGWEDFGVQLYDPGAQDKVARLYSVQHLFAEGAIFAPDKDWAEMVMTQVGQFPTGKWDDLVDTCSMAVRHLRDLGLLTRSAERMEEVQESLRYQGREPPPLYPA